MLSLHIFVGCLLSQKKIHKRKENNDTQLSGESNLVEALVISEQTLQSFMFTDEKKKKEKKKASEPAITT